MVFRRSRTATGKRSACPCHAVALIGLLILGGCGRDSPGQQAGEPRLLLYCGAGIRPPVAELIELFERETGVAIDADYAGSEMLLAKLKLSGRGDLYLPGDRHYTDLAAAQGLVQSRRTVCYFVPTILVQKGNPKRIAGLRDLLRDDVKLGIGDEKACAVGRTSRQIFDKAGIPWADVQAATEFRSLTVNELGLQVQTRALDAAIVWDAVARYYPDACEEVPIPVDENVISTVDAAVLSFTKQGELARRFAELAASERGRAVFTKHHYRVEPPATAPAGG